MIVNGKTCRTIWPDPDNNEIIKIIDQRWLPHKIIIEDLKTVDDFATAIKDMHVRGAGLIGATAGYAMYIAVLKAPKTNPGEFTEYLNNAAQQLIATRPTAVNLKWAVDRMLESLKRVSLKEAQEEAFKEATAIADEDAEFCKSIGQHGLDIIKKISEEKKGKLVNILTHCNAGWLAFVDYGSATAPIYAAQEAGIAVHVYVDVTGPRNQGARLTAWEFEHNNISYTLVADNTGGHLMQKELVDIVIVGTDRTLYTGYVANKIGTYLKALAAKDNNVPFYVALPSSTFDWKRRTPKEIIIEERGGEEVKYARGWDESVGKYTKVLLTPKNAKAANYAFDVTPPYLITGLITDKGVCKPNERAIRKLYNK
ncbi:MAG: S-methyl-5-thioribose-1-phosphate isomerase [Candidatus Woesearchaeota archaeon]|nr:MAG: S-methyl-5-thioribose-1-phosphate isomerase [Candidatus Woesearchaeota archaeon]